MTTKLDHDTLRRRLFHILILCSPDLLIIQITPSFITNLLSAISASSSLCVTVAKPPACSWARYRQCSEE